MRIYVNVPQAFLGELKPGIKATLRLPGQQESFEAELALSRTRWRKIREPAWSNCRPTIQTENSGPVRSPRFISTFLRFGHGERADHGVDLRRPWDAAAVVGADDKVVLRNVIIGRNLGNRIEVNQACLCPTG